MLLKEKTRKTHQHRFFNFLSNHQLLMSLIFLLLKEMVYQLLSIAFIFIDNYKLFSK